MVNGARMQKINVTILNEKELIYRKFVPTYTSLPRVKSSWIITWKTYFYVISFFPLDVENYVTIGQLASE